MTLPARGPTAASVATDSALPHSPAPRCPAPGWAELTERAGATADRLATPLMEPPDPPCDDQTRRRWGRSLVDGAAGVLVLHGVRARAHEAPAWVIGPWREEATRAAASPDDGDAAREAAPDAAPEVGGGLWNGPTAVAHALHLVDDQPGDGDGGRAALELDVDRLLRTRLVLAHEQIDAGRPPEPEHYGLAEGLTGFGAHLLAHHQHSPRLREVLRYLVRFGEIIASALPTAAGGGLGMEGGVAGPIALLALASRAGVRVPGQDEAIARLSSWLWSFQQPGPTGPWWPSHISPHRALDLAPHQGDAGTVAPGRASWSRGTAGIARALQLAALALDHRDQQWAAETALLACLDDPAQLRRLPGPQLRDGWAGVLISAWHAALDTEDSQLHERLAGLLATAITSADNHPTPHGEGLLDGPAGVALALQTVASARPTAPAWAGCLLVD